VRLFGGVRRSIVGLTRPALMRLWPFTPTAANAVDASLLITPAWQARAAGAIAAGLTTYLTSP
jgi:hypothetical protein